MMLKIDFSTDRKIWIGLFSILFFTHSLISAQENTNREFVVPARFEHIEALKSGILIVRLNSNRRKMEALTSLAEKDTLNKKSYQDKLDKTRLETETFNKKLALAFKQNYVFSKVVYIYDFQVPELKKSPTIEVISDMESGEKYLLEVNGTDWYLLSDDNTYNPGPESYRLFDRQMEQMPKGFPGQWKKNDFWHVLIGVFNHKKSKHRDMDLMLQNWNKELFYLYYKARGFRLSVHLVSILY
jgi:hypothetical protein